ncbi:MAG: insulinase family protein [Nitrospiraceae bacterium]|nr:MAG: insulinase family protein [Nitrospiraceae bacterium]
MVKTKLRNITLIAFLFLILFCFIQNHSYGLDIQHNVFRNGLTLITVERHHLPIVKVTVGIKAGSLIEPEEKAGLANLAAILLTSGTKTRTGAEINEEVEYVGASLNASGGDDYITVNLSVLKKDIHLGFDLLSDVLLNPSFPEDELDKKRERVKGRLKAQEEDPGFVASKEFKKSIFGGHPYGRLVAGSAETLDVITRSDLVEFHRTFYTPNNAIMSVVGDVTVNEVKNLLERYFSEWEKREVNVPSIPEPATEKKKEMIVIDKDLTQANIVLGHIGIRRDDPDYYAVSVMNYILGGGGFASRLMQNIREEKGLVYDIHSFFSADKFSGSFQIGLQTKNESANFAIEEILDEIIMITKQPVSDEELSDAQSFLTGSFPMRIETSSRIARFLVAVEFYELGIDYIDKYPEYINSITKEDVLRVAKKYLDPKNIVLVVVANQREAALKKKFID